LLRFRSFLASGLIILLPGLSFAQDLESLHIIQRNYEVTERLGVVLHTRLRTNDQISRYFQFRGGPIVNYDLKPRLRFIQGFYVSDFRALNQEPSRSTRFFGGAQVRLLEQRNWTVEGRSLMERFFVMGRPDYWRFRNRLLATVKRGGYEWISHAELLRGQERFIYRGGVAFQKDLPGGMRGGLGYEFRRGTIGSAHIISTTLNLPTWRRSRTP
jgi:hypothetical protein